MIKAVIFDMDGTVIDTEPMSYRAWKEALLENGYRADETMLMEHVGITSLSAMKLFRQTLGDDFPYWEVRKDARRIRAGIIEQTGVPVKKGFAQLCAELDRRHIKKIIATSTAHDEAVEVLKIAGIYECFDSIIGGDEITEGKPDPEIFLKAQAISGAEKQECLIIEDSNNGIRAAYASGIRCVFIPDMKDCEAELNSCYFAKVARLDEVADFLKNDR